MLKAAIEKIQDITKPYILRNDDHTYAVCADGKYVELVPNVVEPETVTLHSLSALVAFVKEEGIQRGRKLFLTVPDHERAVCCTSPDPEQREIRSVLYDCIAADVPGWGAKVSLGFEEAIIALRTRFQPTADTDYALRLLSSITSGGKVTLNDNGIATTIVTQKGISLQDNEVIRPIISLRPYRTFMELDQPESPFLIRVSERAITFVEADGGMWKLAAKKTAAAFLANALADEISAGQVIVTM